MPYSIMVIDSDPHTLALFDEILTLEGYDVSLYAYGLPSLAEIDRADPALIVLDHISVDEAGSWRLLDLLSLVRATRPLPVVLCSTGGANVRRQDGWPLAPGISYVAKPFEIDDLLAAIRAGLAMVPSREAPLPRFAGPAHIDAAPNRAARPV
jgi:two-component system nitrogen regulation response regulator GlnG